MSNCSQIFSDEALLKKVQEMAQIPVGTPRSQKAGAGGGSESASQQEAARIIALIEVITAFFLVLSISVFLAHTFDAYRTHG